MFWGYYLPFSVFDSYISHIYCSTLLNFQYRAPEEFAEGDLDEKIDVYSMGNNIYALLTGLWIFYDNDNDEEVQQMLIDGERAFIHPQWNLRSYIEGELVDIMKKCWEHDRKKRIDIFTVVRLLREVLKKSNERIKH